VLKSPFIKLMPISIFIKQEVFMVNYKRINLFSKYSRYITSAISTFCAKINKKGETSVNNLSYPTVNAVFTSCINDNSLTNVLANNYLDFQYSDIVPTHKNRFL
jgi:hypothetical protein